MNTPKAFKSNPTKVNLVVAFSGLTISREVLPLFGLVGYKPQPKPTNVLAAMRPEVK